MKMHSDLPITHKLRGYAQTNAGGSRQCAKRQPVPGAGDHRQDLQPGPPEK